MNNWNKEKLFIKEKRLHTKLVFGFYECFNVTDRLNMSSKCKSVREGS